MAIHSIHQMKVRELSLGTELDGIIKWEELYSGVGTHTHTHTHTHKALK